MNFVIKTNQLLSNEDVLLDMEIELWELEFELGMPMWYWLTTEAKNRQAAKVKVMQNRIRAIKNKLNKSENYE